jgi:xanthine dehydrogenase YagS FAD-binding subunit
LTTLEDLQDEPLAAQHHGLLHVVDGVRAIQIQSMGTLGGDLCHLPNCWYFRNGYGLLAMEDGESLVASGDNRYHAIFANQGPAKFVSASRFAPALIAWGARVRVIGPQPGDEEWLPVEFFFQTPRTDSQGVTVLGDGQLVSHLWVPDAQQTRSATYDVMQLEGLDWPLASASVCLDLEGGLVRAARVVLGHVAPIPWVSHAAAEVLLGQPVTEATADLAGEAAVSGASPLSHNEYRVRLARTAVKRAILKATDQLEGGL